MAYTLLLSKMCNQIIGDRIKDSEQSYLIAELQDVTPGSAGDFQNACLVTKTKHAHQVSVAILYNYITYVQHDDEPMTMEAWKHTKNNPLQFKFVSLIMEIEMKTVSFAVWQGKYALLIESIDYFHGFPPSQAMSIMPDGYLCTYRI